MPLNQEDVNAEAQIGRSLTNLVGIEDRCFPEHGLQTSHTTDDVLDLDGA